MFSNIENPFFRILLKALTPTTRVSLSLKVR